MSNHELSAYYTNVLSSQQLKTKAALKFWEEIKHSLEEFIAACSGHLPGEVGSSEPAKNTLQLTYLGRLMLLTCDACEHRITYRLYSASQLSAKQIENVVAEVETGWLQMSADGEFWEGSPKDKLSFLTSWETRSNWPVPQQISERLLARLIMPKWKDDRFGTSA